MRFRKKPVEVEAMKWTGSLTGEFRDWLGAAEWRHVYRDDTLHIPTLEGTMTANPGDWIIRGVAGEFYPCKPDIFAATYEPVEAARGDS